VVIAVIQGVLLVAGRERWRALAAELEHRPWTVRLRAAARS
jgi:hypothetical protein